MQITGNGLKRPECQDIEPIQNNVDILEEHLSDTEVHVNAGRIAGITEPDELSQIDSTDNNSTIWGKIKKSISVLNDHVDTVASETILGHIKIGTGLQTEKDGATCVKIADNLETDDSTTALSAAMGQSLNENKAPNNHASTATTYGVGNASSYGHVKLSDNYVSSDGAASAGVGASSKAVYDSYNTLNVNLAKKLDNPKSIMYLTSATVPNTLLNGFIQYKGTSDNTLTLPNPVGIGGNTFTIWNNSKYTLTLKALVNSFFDSSFGYATTMTMDPDQAVTLFSDEYNWLPLSGTQIGAYKMARIVSGGFKIQSGISTSVSSIGDHVNIPVTFSTPFTSLPIIIVTAECGVNNAQLPKYNNSAFDYAVADKSKTGFTILSNQSVPIAYYWIAVGN